MTSYLFHVSIGIYSIYIYVCSRARYDSPSYRPGYHSQVSEPGAGARAGREVAGSREGYHSLDNRGYRHRDYRYVLPVDITSRYYLHPAAGTAAVATRATAAAASRTASGQTTGTGGPTGEY